MNTLAIAVALVISCTIECANAQPFDLSHAQFAPRLNEVSTYTLR
jgi:hypothetical protein